VSRIEESAESPRVASRTGDYYSCVIFQVRVHKEQTMRDHFLYLLFFLAILIGFGFGQSALADDVTKVQSAKRLERIHESLERALIWLNGQQERSGGFPTDPLGEPGVTSLCTLAFMSQGHFPGNGKYGTTLNRGIHYVLESQKKSGLIAREVPNGPEVPHVTTHEIGRTSAYNHAISALMLSEAFGMVDKTDSQDIRQAVEKALAVTLAEQRRKKPRDVDRGGWRYLDSYEGVDSDLSVVSWQVMFLRSARNAGFDVPEGPINDAAEYVGRCFMPATGQFQYEIGGRFSSRGMTGAGILSLALAGKHNTPEAQKAAQWLLSRPFDDYNQNEVWIERYHYSVFYCCHAMYQMGEEYREKFFAATADTLLKNQNTDGSWDPERDDEKWGNSLTTALVVLGLSAPDEQLPIFQR
jgi:hypothetical protein